MKGKNSSLNDESVLLTEVRERPRPLYLLIGEPFQTEPLARRLIDLLIPSENRGFNLETYTGRTTTITRVISSLRMRGLFHGTKVVWVREPALFLSTEKRGDTGASLFEAWKSGRRGDAAGKLLTLAALAGWTQEKFEEADWQSLSASSLEKLLGRKVGAEERRILAEVHAHCREQKLMVAGFRDESVVFEDFLKGPFPEGSVLILTVSPSAVDKRKRVVKRVAVVGRIFEQVIERERSGALSPASIDRLIDRTLAKEGKRIASAARRLIHRRAGTDASIFVTEMEKLLLYVGEAEEVHEEDVRESVRDLAESWIFDFTKALSQRDGRTALRLLRGLFAQGEHPLRLLALIARELRILLLARDCLTGPLAGQWTPKTSFPAFRDRLWPGLSREDREGFAGIHPYAVYLALQNAARTRREVLERAVLNLQRLDVKLKSSAGDPRIQVEAFVLALCGVPVRRGR